MESSSANLAKPSLIRWLESEPVVRSAMYSRAEKTPETRTIFLRIDANAEPRWGVARKKMDRIRLLNSGVSLDKMKAYLIGIDQ